jgi:hypothetical protein
VFNGSVRFLRALPVLPVVLLAGCGVAGTQFHPGVAAQVGDQTITTRHVDEVTDNYCTALETVTKGQSQQQVTQTPLRYFSHEFATALIVEAAAEQLADEYGVEPTSSVQSDLAQLEPQLSDLDEGEKDAVREVVGAQTYADDVLTQIGASSLEDQGKANAAAEDQLAEGRNLLRAWVDDHDVEINPKYGIEFGTPEQVDTDLSYALGKTAKAGLNAEPDDAYTSGLPDHLVCLD